MSVFLTKLYKILETLFEKKTVKHVKCGGQRRINAGHGENGLWRVVESGYSYHRQTADDARVKKRLVGRASEQASEALLKERERKRERRKSSRKNKEK